MKLQSMLFLRWVPWAATFFLFAVTATGQVVQPRVDQQAAAPLQVTSRLVVLDVVVTDPEGKLRDDLGEGDFRITENGVPQTVISFEPPSVHPLPSGLPITSTEDLERRAPQSPINIVVLDELNTNFDAMAYARYALKKYLDAAPGQLPSPTMLMAVTFDKASVLHDYT